MEIECQRLTDGLQNTRYIGMTKKTHKVKDGKFINILKLQLLVWMAHEHKKVYAHFFTLWGFGLPTAMAKGQESFIKMLAQKNAVPTVISILQTPRKIKIIDTCTVKLS